MVYSVLFILAIILFTSWLMLRNPKIKAIMREDAAVDAKLLAKQKQEILKAKSKYEKQVEEDAEFLKKEKQNLKSIK